MFESNWYADVEVYVPFLSKTVSPVITFCSANAMDWKGKFSLPKSASLPSGATYQIFFPLVETVTLSEKSLVLLLVLVAFTLYL